MNYKPEGGVFARMHPLSRDAETVEKKIRAKTLSTEGLHPWKHELTFIEKLGHEHDAARDEGHIQNTRNFLVSKKPPKLAEVLEDLRDLQLRLGPEWEAQAARIGDVLQNDEFGKAIEDAVYLIERMNIDAVKQLKALMDAHGLTFEQALTDPSTKELVKEIDDLLPLRNYLYHQRLRGSGGSL